MIIFLKGNERDAFCSSMKHESLLRAIFYWKLVQLPPPLSLSKNFRWLFLTSRKIFQRFKIFGNSLLLTFVRVLLYEKIRSS